VSSSLVVVCCCDGLLVVHVHELNVWCISNKKGLIPHSGQFLVEDHGDLYEKDIHVNKPWEEELIQRGLVIKPKEKTPRKEDDFFN
jgi:hypothetical protein